MFAVEIILSSRRQTQSTMATQWRGFVSTRKRDPISLPTSGSSWPRSAGMMSVSSGRHRFCSSRAPRTRRTHAARSPASAAAVAWLALARPWRPRALLGSGASHPGSDWAARRRDTHRVAGASRRQFTGIKTIFKIYFSIILLQVLPQMS